jgi:hypothetical protein
MASGACTCKLTAVETGFTAGIRAVYAGQDARINDAENLGNLFGVSRSVEP